MFMLYGKSTIPFAGVGQLKKKKPESARFSP